MVVLTTHNRVQVHVYKRNVGCGECGLVKKEVALEEEEVTKENHKKLIINKNLLTRNVNKKERIINNYMEQIYV